MSKTTESLAPVVAEPARVSAAPDTPEEKFFSWIDWSAFWIAFAVVFGVYLFTTAPTVTMEDCGELSTGSAHLGVPHPPGYPIWAILTWGFTKLLFFARFRGQPNPAWSVAVASAFFGALAAGFTSILICRSGRDLLRSLARTTERIGTRMEDAICWTAGVAASLVMAFSPVVWSQSVIVEVYSLNAFFLVAILFLGYVWFRRPHAQLPVLTWSVIGMGVFIGLVMAGLVVKLLSGMNMDNFWQVGVYYLGYTIFGLLAVGLLAVIWRQRPRDRILYLTAFLFGLGLTNYQVLLLLLVALAVMVMVRDLGLFRDFLIAGAPYGIVIALILTGYLPGIDHPTHKIFYAYFLLNLVWLATVYFLLPNGRTVAPSVLSAELGFAVYAYMPLSSETNPPINWGYPRTWEGFQHAIGRGQYERIVPTPIFSMDFLRQVGDYLSDLRGTFTLPIVIAGLLPFAAWNVRVGQRRYQAIVPAVIMALLAVSLIVLEEVVMPAGQDTAWLSRPYQGLIVLMAIVMTIGVAVIVVTEVRDLWQTAFGRFNATTSDRLLAGLVLLGVAAVVLLVEIKLAGRAIDPASGLTAMERAGMFAFMLGPLVLAGLILHLSSSKSELCMDFDDSNRKWMLATLAGFLVMSVVLVDLASLKGDIQDMFIQRVKFISSHALFAFWVGYGIVIGLATLAAWLVRWRALAYIAIAGALIVPPLIPLAENAYNKELIRINGGAEMNGHDYGWQFGNYQLRGAEAIIEELSPNEEPLPNPEFPPEMGPGAIFFGGTDPGRFVPTYMIYNAVVRPDVFLITQNALADNTYMSVMRDLYGDAIWIPAVVDGNRAFSTYVEDVRAGRTPASADIKIENGRVQVQGVGGVMLINGILCQMIFDYNKRTHSFYVEESYVINWMYPYLTPHGLIMKINSEKTPLTEANTRDDLAFWDWYTRRLTGEQMFLRDVVARKSFSKLRSAVAGLYSARGRMAESEQAFREALALYPLSPEANFRLADLYLRANRAGDAVALMESFCRQDPGNDRAAQFVAEMKGRAALNQRRGELEKKLGGAGTAIGDALELADVYRRLGMIQPFVELCRSLLKNQQLPPQAYQSIARMAAEQRMPDLLAEALTIYCGKEPTDGNAWLELAAARAMQSHWDDTLKALQQAVRAGGEPLVARIRTDRRFAPLQSWPAFQRLIQTVPISL